MDMDTTAMVPMNQAQASLLPAPNLSLTGHSAAVYSLSFSPDGSSMCSGSFDKTILLWSIGPYCENHNVLAGHKNAVTQVVWSGSGDRIYSSSADKAVHCYDAMSGELLKRHTSSKGVVNGVAVETGSCNLFASVGDDKKVRLNDARVKRELAAVPTKFANTAVAFSTDNMNVFFGGIDNTVTALDLRQLHAAADDDMMEDGATRVL
jgi:Prp8 binding protein